MALVLAAPLTVFARAMDRRLYPGAAIRLLVFRPFWYLQLLVPLVGLAGVIGAAVALPFGASGPAGRYGE